MKNDDGLDVFKFTPQEPKKEEPQMQKPKKSANVSNHKVKMKKFNYKFYSKLAVAGLVLTFSGIGVKATFDKVSDKFTVDSIVENEHALDGNIIAYPGNVNGNRRDYNYSKLADKLDESENIYATLKNMYATMESTTRISSLNKVCRLSKKIGYDSFDDFCVGHGYVDENGKPDYKLFENEINKEILREYEIDSRKK